MSFNKKVTTDEVASIAAKVLKNPRASAIQKKLAASALSQKEGKKQSGAELEDIAAKVLRSKKYSALTKKLAGSVLSQANKER